MASEQQSQDSGQPVVLPRCDTGQRRAGGRGAEEGCKDPRFPEEKCSQTGAEADGSGSRDTQGLGCSALPGGWPGRGA